MSIGSGITSAVDDIVRAAMVDRKERESYEAAVGRINALSQMGVKGGQIVKIDPNIKDKDIVPFVNKKALDDIRNNKQLNRAQKQGEIKAYTDIGMANLRMQLQQAARDAANPRTQYQVAPGYPKRNLAESQAAQLEASEVAAKARGQANIPKEKREARRDVREEGRFQKEMGAPERDLIKNAPENKFFNETGIPPSALLKPTSLETGYQAVDPATKQVFGEIDPIQPGKPVPEAYIKIKNLFGQETGKEPAQWVAKPGGAYRVNKYEYGADKKTGLPKEIKYAPHPEGEFLQIGDKRVPYQDAVGIRAIADTRRREAIRALQINPNLRPKIENRLQEWHYDLTDPFWADLYK